MDAYQTDRFRRTWWLGGYGCVTSKWGCGTLLVSAVRCDRKPRENVQIAVNWNRVAGKNDFKFTKN